MGATHDLQDEFYLESGVGLLSGFCVYWCSVKDRTAAVCHPVITLAALYLAAVPHYTVRALQ